ncbi:GntR family transcriptional regulator [Methylobacterium crusticola]|nr:GntR family transcriptional regulator [Methylobacterium crusticola]
MYQQLEEQLRALIEDGTLTAGTTLPAERPFAEAMGISRTTVQRCYDALRRQRFLSAHGRLGFIVEAGRTRLSPGMDRLKGFTEEMREIGRVPSSEIIERVVVYDRSIASIFGQPSTAPFLKLVRIRRGDGIPLSREVAWYDLGVVPEMAEADLSGSVYAFLGSHGAALVRCRQTIEAATPDAAECAVFGFTEPLPCLLIKRCSYARDDRMVEYVEGLFRGDAYAYRLDLRA